ncbi:DNA topoisomerase [Sulfitobacter sp. R18_1]|uniref:DNA topoisomerase n=1 Tax=Sulfitobacter sp. R18_1 TaxID=2821104 RepID=UPI001ADA1DE1|nr:DNA topoisomerase [Sulfitobacter sp. R18_1]MBO9428420.1 type IA DNA topoisomerase [Sulfitobacter sp. R18_1]
MVKSLFVIEAPGKIKSLGAILDRIGLDARVQATSGHLYELPEDLRDVGLDKKLIETKRTAKNDKVIYYLRKEAKEAEQVFIATDADAEGDVIAWDTYELIKDIHPDVMRVKLKGMDPESIEASLNEARPIRKEDAIPGRTRAIVDRLIGHTFSKDGVGVGRVATGLLGLIHHSQGNISTMKVRLTAPSRDGTEPWVAHFHVNKKVDEQTAEKLVTLHFPALDMKAKAPSSNKLMHMGEVMVRAGDELGMTPNETATSMQRMYESGQMSYPRSSAKGVSKGASSRLARMIKKTGFRGKAERLAEKEETEVHDAPYPIGDVDVSKDPRKLGDDHGVRTMVAREFVKSSVSRERQLAASKKIYDFLKSEGFSDTVAEYISKLQWTREIGPRFPGEKSFQESGIERRMPETVLLEKAVKIGLGRPSTWSKHIDNFMSRGLCDEDLNLTEKGKEWVAKSPPELLDPRVSKAIEAACERVLPGMMDADGQEPWSVLAEKIVAGALPEKLSGPMMSVLEEHVPGTPTNSYAEDVLRADPAPETPDPENVQTSTFKPKEAS